MSCRHEYLAQVSFELRALWAGLSPTDTDIITSQLLASIPERALADRQPSEMAQALASLLDLLYEREPGHSKVHVHSPLSTADGAWTVVEVVNDDMPFLVDSIVAELTAYGLSIRCFAHPVIHVRRLAGKLVGLFQDAQSGHGARESVMYIEVEGSLDGQACREVTARLQLTLADVRHAATDWPQMSANARELALRMCATGGTAPDREEGGSLLAWLAEGNFSFLGFCSFKANEGGGWMVDPVVSAGICRETGVDRISRSDILIGSNGKECASVFKVRLADDEERPLLLDAVTVRHRNASREVIAIDVFLGLFTSAGLSFPPTAVPVLRKKVAEIVRQSGFRPDSHNLRTLHRVLDTYPREELFRQSVNEVTEVAMRIVAVQKTPSVVTFAGLANNDRLASVVAYVPRDRCDATFRQAARKVLEDSFGGRIGWQSIHLSDFPLARLHFIVNGRRLAGPEQDELERILKALSQTWEERLVEALRDRPRLAMRYGYAFPAAYRQVQDIATAMGDIDCIEAQKGPERFTLVVSSANPLHITLRAYARGTPILLSRILSILNGFGLDVVVNMPYQLAHRANEPEVWIDVLTARVACPTSHEGFDFRNLERAIEKVWAGEAENDQLNRLVISTGLTWREVSLLRAYGRYLRQTSSIGPQSFERVLASHAGPTRALVHLFHGLLDPAVASDEAASSARQEFLRRLELEVPGAEEDRIFRCLEYLVMATLRTNFYQFDIAGERKDRIALKLDCQAIDWLAQPRPWVEVFIYSPRVEAVHLRGGAVARGGIRWSDRHDDFRTEILGLLKAQMVKNAVIVPDGAKGGFIVKDRKAGVPLQEQAVECYQTMIRGLLDITDNLVEGVCTHPAEVVCRDGEDPYLVVAADKGTATFSDIANNIARTEYRFWLDDAFASGGSCGYDHKKMGITARGAWESVRHHFSELGRDADQEQLTVVGVGDMSGDVFGNGMLLSPHLRLVAAFDHRHIFLDPNPDPQGSFEERRRIFALARSSWDDYRSGVLSPGGAIVPRDAKSIEVSSQVASRLGLTSRQTTPNALIQAILRADVDLLWFGGIGTYVKASKQGHVDANDRVNDPIRIDANTLRAKVVAEGANLAITQAARVEYALGGGRINTDAIDNSAGVDTSDHEVNIKILLSGQSEEELGPTERARMLSEMTEEVAQLVLRNNRLQNIALAMDKMRSEKDIAPFIRTIALLERAGGLNRELEGLPTDQELHQRAERGGGLTRPELAVVMAYSKNWVARTILANGHIHSSTGARYVADYFPPRLGNPDMASRHRLSREIDATLLANCVINHAGMTFLSDVIDQTSATVEDALATYMSVREIFGFSPLWNRVEDPQGRMPASDHTAATRIQAVLQRLCVDLLATPFPSGDVAPLTEAAAYVGSVSAFDHIGRLEAMWIVPDMARLQVETRCDPQASFQILAAVDGALNLRDFRHTMSAGAVTGDPNYRQACAMQWERLEFARRRIAATLLAHRPTACETAIREMIPFGLDDIIRLDAVLSLAAAGKAGKLETLVVAAGLVGAVADAITPSSLKAA